MKELKRTVTTEETYGYEAFDGTRFRTRDDCIAYESSASAVAKKAALSYVTKATGITCVLEWAGYDEEGVKVFDLPNADALQIVNTYLRLCDSYGGIIQPDMIGHRVAVQFSVDEDYYVIMGDRDMMTRILTENLNRLFADPTPASNT